MRQAPSLSKIEFGGEKNNVHKHKQTFQKIVFSISRVCTTAHKDRTCWYVSLTLSGRGEGGGGVCVFMWSGYVCLCSSNILGCLTVFYCFCDERGSEWQLWHHSKFLMWFFFYIWRMYLVSCTLYYWACQSWVCESLWPEQNQQQFQWPLFLGFNW